MALSWKARRRWALVILLLAMPAYVVAVITVLNLFPRLPFLAELAVYVGLGILWALPLRFIFRGVGQPDPEAGKARAEGPDDRGRHPPGG